MSQNQIPSVCKDFIINVSFASKKASSLFTNVTYKKQFSPLTWQILPQESGIEFRGKSLDEPLLIPYTQLRSVDIHAYGRTSPTLGLAATSCNYFIQLALYIQDGSSLAFETFEYEALKEILTKLKEYHVSVYDPYQMMDMLCTKTNEDISAYFEQRFDAAAKTYGLAAFKNDYQR